MTPTESFAAWAAQPAIPDASLGRAEDVLLDTLACAAAGGQLPEAQQVRSAMAETHESCMAPETFTVAGHMEVGRKHGAPLSLEGAAFVNAFQASLVDADDTHVPTMAHLGAPTVAAVLSVASVRPLVRRDALRAIVVGYQIGAQVGSMAQYRAGWHNSATAGTIASAAAASAAMGLKSSAIVAALSLASSFASGLRIQFGTPARAAQVGNAAASGLRATMLASYGVRGSHHAIDGEHGFLSMHNDSRRASQFALDLSGTAIMETSFKPYSSALVTHGAIDAAFQLRRRLQRDDGRVAHIDLYVAPLTAELAYVQDPSTPYEARLSLSHAVAVGLAIGRAGPAEFDLGVMTDAHVSEIRRLVRVTADPRLGPTGARIVASLASGERLRVEVAASRGTGAKPMSKTALARKYSSYMEGVYPRSTSRAIERWVRGGSGSMQWSELCRTMAG